jgi:hypothetical protein
MTAGERLVALACVAKALLDPNKPAPELCAWNEAAVHAVYRTVQRWASRSQRICRLAQRAGAEDGMQKQLDAHFRGEDLSPLEAPEIVEVLMDGVLWDRHFDLGETYHSALGEYFVFPPVATPDRIEAAEDYFCQLRANWPARNRGNAP